jgi:phosphatidylinositol glycan class S
MRTTPYAPAYQITFSLLNGDPSTLHVDWDVRAAIAYHMRPFLSAVSSVYNFTIDSQVQHYATLAFEPERNTKARWRDQYYYLTAENLPHFINSAEWNLGK